MWMRCVLCIYTACIEYATRVLPPLDSGRPAREQGVPMRPVLPCVHKPCYGTPPLDGWRFARKRGAEDMHDVALHMYLHMYVCRWVCIPLLVFPAFFLFCTRTSVAHRKFWALVCVCVCFDPAGSVVGTAQSCSVKRYDSRGRGWIPTTFRRVQKWMGARVTGQV